MSLSWYTELQLLSTPKVPMSCCESKPQLQADVESFVQSVDSISQAAFGINLQGLLGNLARCAAQNVNVVGVMSCLASGQKLQNCILPNLNLTGFITCALASLSNPSPSQPPSPSGPQASTTPRC